MAAPGAAPSGGERGPGVVVGGTAWHSASAGGRAVPRGGAEQGVNLWGWQGAGGSTGRQPAQVPADNQ